MKKGVLCNVRLGNLQIMLEIVINMQNERQIELEFYTVFFHAWLRQYSSTAGCLGKYHDSFHLNEKCNYILL